MTKLLDEIRKLSPDERRALIVEIQSTLDEDGADDALTPAQRAELERRIRKYENDPEAWRPLDEVLARMESHRQPKSPATR